MLSTSKCSRTCVMVLALLCLVSAWKPEKKVVKWSPTFFRPAANHRMCGSVGSPCGNSQKHYGLFWRSTTCCFGLECIDAIHGSFCTEPADDYNDNDSAESVENRISLEQPDSGERYQLE
ncbi:hypothetical protein BV898_01055 [Hypsibius exemplaris]|uniref:Uncharacterized protein n=1 Tax=Hypsibius exemplaris TaxID=2072580 RepID=A0A1W0XD21_HYPEX|nr:hypothetical protein BV898_01055 [Hypsibius exemplaris]